MIAGCSRCIANFPGARFRTILDCPLFGGVAAAWSLEAHAQESETMRGTKATPSTLPLGCRLLAGIERPP
jgi:hypothetical protein